ncbi:response regulator [Lysobacter silvisoli]|uniref:histidine kinase n=1 Tax=Lysobacter silvisoli TaxID=2293254 RepID=A0A371K6D9_9GAMM|nr:response regulator [Lysobacter silvisoli]
MHGSQAPLRWLWATLLWALLLPARAALPETPQFRYYGVAEGVPSSTVAALAQDSEGYIWMATHDGLARYDGVSFRVWRHVPGDPGSLPSNMVQALHVDARDRVWVGLSGGGLHMLDHERQSFVHYGRQTHPLIGSDEIYAIASTADGAVWFGTDGAGVHRLAPDGDITRYMPGEAQGQGLPGEYIWTMKTDARGRLWVGTTTGLAYWDGQRFHTVDVDGISGRWVTALSPAADGSLWIGAGLRAFRRTPDGAIEPQPWFDPADKTGVYGVVGDGPGNYWVATHRGLRRVLGGKLVPLANEAEIAQINTLDLLRDHEGGWWFATEERGVAYLAPNWRQFTVLKPGAGHPGAPRVAYMRDLAAAAGNGVWMVGERGVIDRLDLGDGRTRQHAVPALADTPLYSVLQARDGAMWFGSTLGLTRVAPGGAVRGWTATSAQDATFSDIPDQLVETPDGNLWIAYMPPALQMRDRDGRVRVSVRPEENRGIDTLYIEQIEAGPDGALWLAGPSGLARWDAAASRFEPLPGSPVDRVFGFSVVGRDRVWLHRLEALEQYAWDGRSLRLLKRVSGDEGLPATESGGVMAWGDNVWLTTRRGLICWNQRRERLRIYGMRDGLPSQEFTERNPLLTDNGIAVASTMDGVVLFDAGRAPDEVKAPRLVIETLSYRRDEDEFKLDPDRPVVLGPQDRDLRVSARLLSFVDLQTHRYRFRLHGYDPDWVIQSGNGERVFSKLEPGSYRLEVQAANADGIWSASRQFSLSVQPPWWRTPPALAALIGLAILGAWWAAERYRLRLKRRLEWQAAERERELTKQASLAKTRFLATLGHEVRTPMTGVLGMSELLLDTALDPRQRGYTESIQRAGKHLLRLVNDALDLARIESGKLELADEAFDLHVLVADASELMAPLARKRGLAFELEVAADAPRGLRGDPHRVRQILLNLLGNAIKFTEQGRVSLRVSALSPQGARFEVADTGPGLDEEQKSRLFRRFEQAEGVRTAARYGGSGLGLAICQELAAAMNGQIAVDSAPGQGARFVFDLPLPAAAASAGAIAPDRAGDSPRAPLALLLVEDDPTVAEVVAGLLRAQGHRVTHVGNGLAALTEIATAGFDAALLDLDLPGISGLDLARQLRAQGYARPMIAITARADAEAEPQALAAGFDRFLRKPVTGAMLAAELEAALAG